MRLRIAELCESVLLLIVRSLLPARGRHRATPARWSATIPHSLPTPTARPLDDEEPLVMDTPLVRPYLQTLEVFA
ncbi:hypothetical protein PV963_21380 [Streptomyces coeruleorubidus]|uniref:hypothetical protein n=1 Tax=Streptomyces coeruleorubidus TaxID=116188 RepID=UPI00237F6F8A|nr:hypothetical protein [Streptomyces coeruleorubidus]WDV52747.1 hypothetical protein PV963_21380 [Streptomyces coeruleorubidus]